MQANDNKEVKVCDKARKVSKPFGCAQRRFSSAHNTVFIIGNAFANDQLTRGRHVISARGGVGLQHPCLEKFTNESGVVEWHGLTVPASPSLPYE